MDIRVCCWTAKFAVETAKKCSQKALLLYSKAFCEHFIAVGQQCLLSWQQRYSSYASKLWMSEFAVQQQSLLSRQQKSVHKRLYCLYSATVWSKLLETLVWFCLCIKQFSCYGSFCSDLVFLTVISSKLQDSISATVWS